MRRWEYSYLIATDLVIVGDLCYMNALPLFSYLLGATLLAFLLQSARVLPKGIRVASVATLMPSSYIGTPVVFSRIARSIASARDVVYCDIGDGLINKLDT